MDRKLNQPGRVRGLANNNRGDDVSKELFKQLANLTGHSEGYLDRSPTCIPDYMDWNLLMPLALDHDISLLNCGTDYEVSYDFDGVESAPDTDEAMSHHIEVPKCDIQITIVNLLIMKLDGNEN